MRVLIDSGLMMNNPSLLEMFDGFVRGERRDYEAGAPIFKQGDAAWHVYAVETGQVRLERCTLEGRRVLMYVAAPGESFAEAALLHDVFHCDAIAARPSRIVVFPKNPVLEGLRSDPGKAEQVILLLASQVRDLRARLQLRNILSAGDRVMHYLLQEAAEDGVVRLRTALKDIAAELGLARETLYRELARLEDEGVIRRTGTQMIEII